MLFVLKLTLLGETESFWSFHFMRQQQPKTIKRLGNDGLQIVWKDGHQSEYTYPYLRRLCPCAECSTIRHKGQDVHSLFGPDGLGDPDQIFVPADIQPTNLELVGRYAIQFTWSDGHSTGIYSFETLREICPGPQCT
jgi:DUF971 family protein